jgi:hypothetical protein
MKVKTLKEMLHTAVPGVTYRHYKGGLYQVLHLAQDAETEEIKVVYRSVHFGTYYVRSLHEWCTPVNNNPRYWPYTE